MFCLTPWNTFEDMDYVIQLAQHYNIDVRIGIYNTMDFFDTTEDLMEVGNDYIKRFRNQSIIHRKILTLWLCTMNGKEETYA